MHFDSNNTEDYSKQAQTLYGHTDAYQEYETKSKNRTKDQETELGQQVMDFFVRLGKLHRCAPDCEEALAWAKELQDFFTAHFYTCTPQLFAALAESYACEGSMKDNIDNVGGAGTGDFAKQVIHAYLKTL